MGKGLSYLKGHLFPVIFHRNTIADNSAGFNAEGSAAEYFPWSYENSCRPFSSYTVLKRDGRLIPVSTGMGAISSLIPFLNAHMQSERGFGFQLLTINRIVDSTNIFLQK